MATLLCWAIAIQPILVSGSNFDVIHPPGVKPESIVVTLFEWLDEWPPGITPPFLPFGPYDGRATASVDAFSAWCVGVDAQGVYYDTLPLTDLGTTMPAVVSLRFSIEKAVPFFPGAGKNAQSFDVVIGM
jgi:hypothetical protein